MAVMVTTTKTVTNEYDAHDRLVKQVEVTEVKETRVPDEVQR